jgi:TP901 family phage tail tape measure protein
MADIESNIKVNIDTSDALAQLKLLQQQISAFQQAMRNAGQANAQAAAAMQQNLVNSINATGKFRANIQTIKTSAESFTEALEKNKMSIGEYFRYAGGASKTFGKLFKSEFATIQQVAEERVKTLQTQFIKLGRDANGAMKAIAVRPLALDMDSLSVKTQMAAQRQQLFNQLMKQGSTQLLNFGKNTQWAGRQLMVGFTVPLTMMGAAAAKAYMQIEAASIKFKRVYGDMNTTSAETGKMVKQVQALANEFTKYGLAVADTMDMAAQAAAMGKTGADLLAQINQSAKLAVLGGVEQSQALETTISLTNAFGVAADKLSGNIDFLNAVENQTVLSIEDLTVAIPKAAPVIKQLGGDVKDLAFFMTAMKEGGINASEGANAIKSGLASLINPTAKASQFLAQFGINVKGIVEADKGDIRKTVIDFAKALDTLDPLNRARAIEQMFGKFQFSRISTLFQNVISEGSQATKVAGLANSTAEELAVLSEREMKKIEDSPMFKFQKSIQDMQAKLAPVGEAFLKAVTPIIEFVSKILDGFNNLSEGSKQFITILVTAVAGIGPLLLMTFGLISNGIANIMKLFTNVKSMINKSTKPSELLGEQTQYMNEEQLRASAIAASLDQAHAKLKQTFDSERTAVEQLTKAYRESVQAQQGYAGVPGVPVGNPNATPKKYAGGTHTVPGPSGAGDIVPALLSPGEAVIPAKQAAKYRPIISGMIAGNLPGFEFGTAGVGMRQSIIGPLTQKQTEGMARTAQQLEEISKEVMAGPYGKVAPTDYGTQVSPTTGHSFPAFGVGGIYQKPDGSKVFVKPQMDLVSAMAEMRGTTIARDAHGLQAPSQKLGVMMDPTDPQNRRRFIVLESPVDEKFAQIPTTFTKDQYFKQLVASLLRGDKDLGLGNLGGDILADVGTAGVFQRASGKRQLGGAINSMEEQAIINLLGVKGGAKRFFAEATSELAKSMTPAEYDAAMKAEIQAVLPRLKSTILGFGNLNTDEKAAYGNMLERLQGGMSVDWGKYQIMHSSVTPKKYSKGNVPKGYTPEQARWINSGLVSKEDIEWVLSLGKTASQKAHLAKELEKTKDVKGFIRRLFGEQMPDSAIENSAILGNFTANVPTWINQRLRDSVDIGIPPELFHQSWNALQGKLYSAASIAKDEYGMPMVDPTPEAASAIDAIDRQIGNYAVQNLQQSNKKTSISPVVYDSSIDIATKRVLDEYEKKGGIFQTVSNAFRRMANIPGTSRTTKPVIDGRKLSGEEAVFRALTVKDETGLPPAVFTPNGKQVIARNSKNYLMGRWKDVAPGSIEENNKKDWIKETQPVFNNPELLAIQLGKLKSLGLGFRDTSQSIGKFSTKKQSTYEKAGALYSKILDRDVFNVEKMANKFGLSYDQQIGFFLKPQSMPAPLKLADGIFSVPGPKGAGDVIPAMLSPGEAVIPAKKAQRYQPLIQQMVHGTIPGYADSNIPDTGGGGMYTFGNPLPVAVIKDYSATPPVTAEDAQDTADQQDAKADKRQQKANAETKKGFGDALTKAFTRTTATGRVQAGLYGATGLLAAASMMPGQIGQAAQSALPAIGAMTGAMQLIPGPAGMVVGALTAIYTIGVQINDHWHKLSEEARTLGEALGTGSKAIGKFAEFAKKATSTEIMNKRRETSAGAFYNVVEGKQTFGESYMQTDNGKQLVKDVGQAVKSVGLKQAKQLMVNQLTTAIVSGALSPEQARSVAANLGAQLGDMQFGIEVIGKMSDLIGPDGKNLKNNPVEVRMKIVAEEVKQFEQVAGQQQKASTKAGNIMAQGTTMGVAGGVVAGLGATAGGAALAGVLAGSAAGSTGALIGSVVGAQAFGPVIGAIAGLAILTKAAIDAQGEIVKNAGYLSASLGSALETQQQMVDSLQLDYEKRIASAKATGDMAEARKLEKQYLADQAQLLQFNKDKTQEMYDILNQQGTGLGFIFNAQAANLDAAAEGLKKAFEGTGLDVQANMAVDTIKAMQGSDAQKTMLLSAVGQKQIGLNQIQTAGQLFGGSQQGADTLQKMMENSPIELNRALGLAGGMSAETGKKFVVDMSLKDPMAAKQMNDAVEMAQKATGVFFGEEKTAKAVMEFAVNNPEKMLEFQQNIKDLQDVDGTTFTIAVAQKILGPDLAKALGEKSVGAYFKKFNKQNKIVFLSEFQQIMTMLKSGDTEMIKSYNTWNAQNGYKKSQADYAAWQSWRTTTDMGLDNTKVPGVDTSTTDTGGPSASFIDPYVQTLREAVRLGQGITVGWKASLAALKNYGAQSIKTMSGQAVLLKQAGASEGLIQAFLGGSEEDQNRMFARAKGGISDVGKFIIAQAKRVEDAKIGMEYILAGATGQMQKDNELYQAGLDVISAKEKKVNDKYDSRIKALDEVGKIQEKNNQRQQDTLTLADALSKGDIAAAARAAMTAKQNDQKQALEDAKSSLELARQNELHTITTRILGVTRDRSQLEGMIATNAEKIAIAKEKELNHQVSIGKQALENANTVSRTLNTLKGYSKIKLPKFSAINTNVINTNSINDAGSSDTGSQDTGVTDGKKVLGGVMKNLKGVKGIAGTRAVNVLANRYAKFNSGERLTEYRATEYGRQQSALKDIQKLDNTLYSAIISGADARTISAYRGQLKTAEDKTLFDTLYAQYKEAKANVANAAENVEALKTQEFNSLPPEIQDAFTKLKDYHAGREAVAQPYRDANKKLKDWERLNPTPWNAADTKKHDALKKSNDEKYQALQDFDALSAGVEKRLTSLGYGLDARKLFAGYARGGMVYASRGIEISSSKYALGTDTIPAMLTPGEFVMTKAAVDRIGSDNLSAMNNGTTPGNSVYNYSITVNANSSDADGIADAVLRQIKRIDGQRIRSSTI